MKYTDHPKSFWDMISQEVIEQTEWQFLVFRTTYGNDFQQVHLEYEVTWSQTSFSSRLRLEIVADVDVFE